LNFNREQQQAIHTLYQAMVQSISTAPDLARNIQALRAVGLCLAEATLDLFIAPIDDDQVPPQSDAEWLKSMRIAPDLEVPHDSQ
jgi:hypothetical protein